MARELAKARRMDGLGPRDPAAPLIAAALAMFDADVEWAGARQNY